jgi:hypothetical protein
VATRSEAADFTGNATLTSDYVRLARQHTHDARRSPAAQAGFKVAAIRFLRLRVGSSVEFAPENAREHRTRFHTWAEQGAVRGMWTLDVQRAALPATPRRRSILNWTELNGTVTYKNNSTGVSLGWSNEALGATATAPMRWSPRIPDQRQVSFRNHAAHYYPRRQRRAREAATPHGLASAVWTFHAPFELRLTAHGTDSNAKHIFGDDCRRLAHRSRIASQFLSEGEPTCLVG